MFVLDRTEKLPGDLLPSTLRHGIQLRVDHFATVHGEDIGRAHHQAGSFFGFGDCHQ
jgi:hypothetical protein